MKKKKVTQPAKRIEYKDYADYLKSNKWKQVKASYESNKPMTSRRCMFCRSSSDLVHHHFRYPKDWNNDLASNLLLVCKKCHSIIHENLIQDYSLPSIFHTSETGLDEDKGMLEYISFVNEALKDFYHDCGFNRSKFLSRNSLEMAMNALNNNENKYTDYANKQLLEINLLNLRCDALENLTTTLLNELKERTGKGL